MGHDVHFLQRLERASHSQVELALSLYRDTPLLKQLLVSAKPPPEAERLAIALDDESKGPFLVVARDGHFVTCLAAGMSPGSLPIISRAKLDSVRAQAAEMRDRLGKAEELFDGEKSTIRFFRHLYEGAHEVTREQIGAAVALHPLIGMEYLHGLGEALIDYTRALVRASKPQLTDDHEAAQLQYWRRLWQVGHFTSLTYAEPEMLARLMEKEPDFPAQVSFTATGTRFFAVATRGLWAANRVGKHVLGAYKKAWMGDDVLARFDAALALGTIACGHSKFEAEICKLLSRGDDTWGKIVLTMLDERDLARNNQIGHGRYLAHGMTAHLPENSPYHFEYPEEVPDDLALTLAANSHGSTLGVDSLPQLFDCLPWLARARIEDLYLPEAFLTAVRQPWDPEIVAEVIERERPPPATPYVAAVTPGRNDPCSCGSGKKFKKCCAA